MIDRGPGEFGIAYDPNTRDGHINHNDPVAHLAWLYGRKSDWRAGDTIEWHTIHPDGVGAAPGSMVVRNFIKPGDLTPDEAVDLARALLTAAEVARIHTD